MSLYSGAGGLDIGFAQAGFAPVFTNDIDRDAIATNRALFNQLAQTHTHLREVPHDFEVGGIGAIELPDRGSADLVIGGPPCQGFSVAGKMDPNDPRSRHVFEFLGAVNRISPEVFVMENVKALAVNRRWSGVLEGLRRRARRLGYSTSLFVLNASDFGVPQARERMFLIGSKSLDRLSAPIATTANSPVTLRDVLQQLPSWGVPGNDQVCPAIVTAAKRPVLRKSPWAGMLFNGQGRPMNLDAPAPTLPASMGGNRTPIVDQLSLDDPEVEPWVIGYHERLCRGKAPVKRVPSRLRRITVQEAAAIQTFPDDTPWQGPQSARYRQIGNAVPPRLALAVARAVLDQHGIDIRRTGIEPSAPATAA